jgi:hypothetical protein
MRAEELKEIIDVRPFTPIRLHMSNGEHVDITHPDAAVVARTIVVIGLGVNAKGIADRTTWFNLLHIVKIEQLMNGKGRPRSGAKPVERRVRR